jgi:hypothetical protein
MTEAEMQTAVAIIRENIEHLETQKIDALIFQALPRITPVDMATIWGKYLTWAKEDVRRHERETELFLAWVSEQEAKGRPESELIFGNFFRERVAN